MSPTTFLVASLIGVALGLLVVLAAGGLWTLLVMAAEAVQERRRRTK